MCDMLLFPDLADRLADASAYHLLLAEGHGVQLHPVDERFGLHFAYLPDRVDWPQIHLSMMATNWRIQVCDAPKSFCAHWCYPGVREDTFLFALDRLRTWGGDPAGEPTGYIKAHDWRTAANIWRRRPGVLLGPADAPWLQASVVESR
jgi:hypothetical protein